MSRELRSSAPAISVLMTSFNREAYIAEAIRSVLAQTFDDFELIVCDDASSDRTVDIAREFEAHDPRVRVVTNQNNVGDYHNRNRAAEHATGRFLKYHDSDDVMYPHCLGVMFSPLEAEPLADFALSASRSWPGGPAPMLLTPRLAYQREFFGSGIFQCGPSCALFRTRFFRSIGGFTPTGTTSDYVFWARVCTHARVLLVPGDLFYYRIHGAQEVTSDRSVADSARGRGLVWQLLNGADCPLRGEEQEIAKRNFMFMVAREAYYHARAGHYVAAVNFLRHTELGAASWLRYLRRPRRSRFAGTPETA
jgi:glycosyltransferase involved in cell wall biosynthesis